MNLLDLTLRRKKDLYDLLSVPRGANEAQIKRSYRKLALKYHPVRGDCKQHWCPYATPDPNTACRLQDKVTGSDEEKKAAEKKFAEINHGELVVLLALLLIT
jgi:curved DNA-binding protein CbpA